MPQKQQDHYYDGWLYHLFVDPALKRLRRLVRAQISPASSLIDIGCGTGELLFSLADWCSDLVGVEASNRMWSFASRRARARNLENVRILPLNAAGLTDFAPRYFDYAVACMVFHEIQQSQRLPVLREMQRLARRLILVDYRVPQPRSLEAGFCRLIERVAGRRHYHNFRTFLHAGGLPPLLEALDVTIREEIPFQRHCFHLVQTQPP